MTRRPHLLVLAPLSIALASTLSAQSISIGLRGTGSVPTGSFAGTQAPSDTALIVGAKNGFGYGLDASVGLGPIGVYASFDHIQFDCQTTTCTSDGKYTLQGATAGVMLSMPGLGRVRPYVKGGVTFNDLQGGYGASSTSTLSTDRTPGYEVGLGFDYSLLGIVAFTPQVRYIGQNFKAKIPGVVTPATANGTGVNYFTFDVGLSLHTPFGGKR